MRLTSEPKPVKVRIMSGGRDHSSLESLRQHFDLDELAGNKEQVQRWLNTLGDEGKRIAEHISRRDSFFCPTSIDEVFATYKTFFKDCFHKHNIASIDDLVRFWLAQDTYKENRLPLLILCSRFDYPNPVLEAIGKGMDLDGELLTTVKDVKNLQVQYKLYHYYKTLQKTEEEEKHLREAVLLGSKEAISETSELLNYQKLAEAFVDKPCDDKELMGVIFGSQYDWNQGVDIDVFFAVLKTNGIDTSRLDKELIEVYFQCCCILEKKTTREAKLEEAQKVFGLTFSISSSPSDWRGKRALFFFNLLAMYAGRFPGAKKMLGLTKDDNYLSQFIYNDIAKTNYGTTSYKYTSTGSFVEDFRNSDIRDFLRKNKACTSKYLALGPKNFENLFNLYFMNTELLEKK